MKKLITVIALIVISFTSYAQDHTFSLRLRNSEGGTFMAIIEDYGNYSYMTVNDITLQIDGVEETQHGIIYKCLESDGVFILELDFRLKVFRVYINRDLSAKGIILSGIQ